jgi:hypothetical protein
MYGICTHDFKVNNLSLEGSLVTTLNNSNNRLKSNINDELLKQAENSSFHPMLPSGISCEVEL